MSEEGVQVDSDNTVLDDVGPELLVDKDLSPKIERIIDALTRNRGIDQERLARHGVDWVDLMLRKNQDYGSSVWKSPVLDPSMPPKSAILVRMSDKINRLQSLITRGEAEVAESLEDTMRDLGAYCLLYCACPEAS